jgi:hypothetical protein
VPAATTAEEWVPETGADEVPIEALAGLAEIAGPPEPQPAIATAIATATAAGSAADEDLRAARAEVEDLRRQLAESERLRREMDGILSGLGIRVRQT